jgi:hypothetical protein
MEHYIRLGAQLGYYVWIGRIPGDNLHADRQCFVGYTTPVDNGDTIFPPLNQGIHDGHSQWAAAKNDGFCFLMVHYSYLLYWLVGLVQAARNLLPRSYICLCFV